MNETASENVARDEINSSLVILTAVLSLFGTVFIIISFFFWKDIQTASRKILVFISVADFFTAVGSIMGLWSSDEKVCLVQSTIGTLSVLCSFFWTVFMAAYLYLAVSKNNLRHAGTLMCAFHLVGWGVPILVVSVAVSTGKLGNNGDMVSSGWCWVKVNMSWNDQVLWMLLAGKGWEIASYFIIAILYFLIRRHIKKELTQDSLLTQNATVQAQRAERKLIFVPLIFILLRIWGTMRFFIMIANGPYKESVVHRWLVILQGIGDTAPGFANFLLFCFFTEKVLGEFHSCCRPCLKLNSCRIKSSYMQSPDFVPTYIEEATQHNTSEINTKEMNVNEAEDSIGAHTNVTVAEET